MQRLLLAVTLCALSACATPCGEAQRPPAGHLAYACADGVRLDLDVAADGRRLVLAQPGYPAAPLRKRFADIGYRYSGRGAALEERFGVMRFDRAGQATTTCQVAADGT